MVNNAGACMTGTFSATSVEDFRSQMDTVLRCTSIFSRPTRVLSRQLSGMLPCVLPTRSRRITCAAQFSAFLGRYRTVLKAGIDLNMVACGYNI